MENKNLTNPWKGLNFYTEGEVLYGRNAEIQSLSQYIFNNTQTVLYGRSGIGKSSILNAGRRCYDYFRSWHSCNRTC